MDDVLDVDVTGSGNSPGLEQLVEGHGGVGSRGQMPAASLNFSINVRGLVAVAFDAKPTASH